MCSFFEPSPIIAHHYAGLLSAFKKSPNFEDIQIPFKLFSIEDIIDCFHGNRSKLKHSTHQNIIRFCMDLGDPRYVIVFKDLNRIARSCGHHKIPKLPSGRRYSFGNHVKTSLGVIELFLDTLQNVKLILVVLDVFNIYVAAFLGLDVLGS